MHAIDPRAETYRNTALLVHLGAVWVPLEDTGLLCAGPVHVITAWDPDGLRAPEADNALADQELFDELVSLGCDPMRIRGASLDSPHFEDGWGVRELPVGAACTVARRYRQVAIFEATQDRLAVIASDGSWTATRSW